MDAFIGLRSHLDITKNYNFYFLKNDKEEHNNLNFQFIF
jgi:hypothetical protein